MRYWQLKECSSSGSTGSSSVASVPKNMTQVQKRNSIGVGFDPNGDYGIYNFAKKKKEKKKN